MLIAQGEGVLVEGHRRLQEVGQAGVAQELGEALGCGCSGVGWWWGRDTLGEVEPCFEGLELTEKLLGPGRRCLRGDDACFQGGFLSHCGGGTHNSGKQKEQRCTKKSEELVRMRQEGGKGRSGKSTARGANFSFLRKLLLAPSGILAETKERITKPTFHYHGGKERRGSGKVMPYRGYCGSKFVMGMHHERKCGKVIFRYGVRSGEGVSGIKSRGDVNKLKVDTVG